MYTEMGWDRVTTISRLCLLTMLMGCSCYANLSTDFYAESCPELLPAVKSVVHQAVAEEPRMAASLLRLFFHDCFVNGCDGSILLDDTSSFKGEKTALPNHNSVRGFQVIDKIKSKVEKLCPHLVSCADIVAIAARDSVVLAGGPNWKVKLGRRDSKTASLAKANSGVIPPPTSTLTNLINRFKAQGLSARDMVALSGAHTIGQARCAVFRGRIYNSSNIESSFAKIRQKSCPIRVGSGDNNLAPLDFTSPTKFDTNYYKLLLNRRGLLKSDQALFNGGSTDSLVRSYTQGTTDSLVRSYTQSTTAFHKDFVSAMLRMGDIKPLTGSSGQIRRNCRRPN